MKRSIRVCLGDDALPVGTLQFTQQGAREAAAFEYDAEWLASRARFAIDPALRLVQGSQFHRRPHGGSPFHSAIADTEPDGWGRRVIQRDHAKRRQEALRAGQPFPSAPLSSLDFLLAVDDTSRLGALRFRDEHGDFCRAPQPGRRTTPPLVELGRLISAAHAIETHTETGADLEYLRGRGTSLGGLRPKCGVIDAGGRLSIAKFPSVTDERPVTKGEVLAMKLARRAGIRAAEAELVQSDGLPVALIARFDRVNERRLLYVSAATMLGADPTDSGEHAYTEIVEALRREGASVKVDLEELWRRVAYSILITNVDDHLQNHGFLHVERGRWRLAPAFDLNPFPERLRELKTWISEESGSSASIEALVAVAPYFGLPRARAAAVLEEVEAAVSRWREQGRALGMTPTELDAFADAFEHSERAAARRLAARKA